MLVKRKSHPLLKAFKFFSPLVLLALIAYGIYWSEVLNIKSVSIAGEGLSEEEVLKYIGEEAVGKNIISWSPQYTEVPKLSVFDIKKNYFTREIKVQIEPRKKSIIWCYPNAEICYWVDDEGYILEESPKISSNIVRVVEDDSFTPGSIGEHVLSSESFRRLISILEILDEFNLSSRRIYFDSPHREIVAELENGPKIIFGLNIKTDFIKPAIKSFYPSDNWSKIKNLNLAVYGKAYASY